MRYLSFLALVLAIANQASAAKRKVIIDQDAFEGPGMQPILMLLQSPDVEVLGITTVSGDGWQPEETARTLRMLEMIDRTDIPVYGGATYPLVNSKELTELREKRYGKLGYKGAWTETWPSTDEMSRADYHGPDVIPPFAEGHPSIEAAEGTAAEFMIEQTKKYPGEVTIIAMGPMTNLALAQRLDYKFASRVKQLCLMGGTFNQPLFYNHGPFALQRAYSPRMSFNYQWDPEAAHIVHTSPFPKISLVTSDASVDIFGTKELLDKIASSDSKVAAYVTEIAKVGFPLWDEVQAGAWLEPDIVTESNTLWIGVDTNEGPNYGAILTWPEESAPGIGERPVEVIYSVDQARMEAMFTELLSH
ncbi:nucleoside hydrolase [Pelagicoccus albus]|uniref:Nucleoside hydrolase n=1 Tax=Pelagicoccus albus TaxID=415222 RepID=A0A7X1E976_9BACT|nr:nucleoside hydrolase [Pelagicoccus albus]MBC2607535.1 nucleoside hydrolase [Pelagicoccus albus]